MLKIEPAIEAFPADRPSVVWTTLVADLETPVSAFLKLADGAAQRASCSNRSRAARCAAAIRSSALTPDLIWRCRGRAAEINRRALHDAGRLRAVRRAAARRRCAR